MTKSNSFSFLFQCLGFLTLCFGLSGCDRAALKPLPDLNAVIRQTANSHRDPSLGIRWLACLSNYKGKEKIELIDLRKRRVVPLPGLNWSDAQPISVSVSANGQRLALVRQRNGQTELLIYKRRSGSLQKLDITPNGVPRNVSLDADGRILAVQVSRNGRWDIDLIRLTS